MSKPSMNLQDSYLNQVRKDGGEVRIIMLDGTELSGHVRGFDNFTVVLQCQNEQHLIYKHAMAHIVSKKPFKREFHELEGKATPVAAPAREAAPAAPSSSADSSAKPAQKTPFNAIDFSQAKSGQ